MNKKSGFGNSYPVIKSVEFPKDKLRVILTDGRILLLPLKNFPEIGKLKPAQKRKHKILAGTGLMFDDLDVVFHISDFLGKVQTDYPLTDYSNQSKLAKVAEAQSAYGASGYKFSDEEIQETYKNSQELKTGKVKGVSLDEALKRARRSLKK